MDSSFKLIFGNHRLFSDFLADFIHIDLLKDVKPEDIEDISERFTPLFIENRDSDTVKRINIKGMAPSARPLFVIAILEHESQVNYRSSFKMLQYISLVLNDWEKDIEMAEPGSSKRKDFKYPPVLPIIFYDGKETWTAERNFLERTYLNEVFEKYIPKFEYELVNLNDYSEEEIMGFGDALSIVLLIDKIRDKKGERLLRQLPTDYAEKLSLQIPGSLIKLLSDVIRVLPDKSGYDRQEIEKYLGYVEKPEGKEKIGMFEAVIEYLIEEREKAREEGLILGQERLETTQEQLEATQERLEDAEERLEDAEERLEAVTRNAQERLEAVTRNAQEHLEATQKHLEATQKQLEDAQKRLEAVARNYLAEGLTIESVSRITGFDMETIRGMI